MKPMEKDTPESKHGSFLPLPSPPLLSPHCHDSSASSSLSPLPAPLPVRSSAPSLGVGGVGKKWGGCSAPSASPFINWFTPGLAVVTPAESRAHAFATNFLTPPAAIDEEARRSRGLVTQARHSACAPAPSRLAQRKAGCSAAAPRGP